MRRRSNIRKTKKSRKYNKRYTKRNKRYTKRNKRYTKRNKRYTRRNGGGHRRNRLLAQDFRDIEDIMIKDARELKIDELPKFNNRKITNEIFAKLEGGGENSSFIKWIDRYKGYPNTPFHPFGPTEPACSEESVIKGVKTVPHICTKPYQSWTLFVTTLDELINGTKKEFKRLGKDIDTITVTELCPILRTLLGFNPTSVIPETARIAIFKSQTPAYIRKPCAEMPQAGNIDTCGYDKDNLPLQLCNIPNYNKFYNIRQLAENNGLCEGEDRRGQRYPFTGNGYTYNNNDNDKIGVEEFIAVQTPKHEIISGGSISLNELINYIKEGIHGIEDRFKYNS